MRKTLKFGGSSMATSTTIRTVADIILKEKNQCAYLFVVVSACQGVTNSLIHCANTAALGNPHYITLFEAITSCHEQIAKDLLDDPTRMEALLTLFEELQSHLQGIYLLKECSNRSLDLIASFGERCAATLLTLYLQKYTEARYVDARNFIITNNNFTHADVIFGETNAAINKYFKNKKDEVDIITGFIGSTSEGQTTTLGRNGSDYSASIIGAALKVDCIEIWTDVNGVYTTDPKVVPSAYVISHLSYEEALELSHFGARVLHSATIGPAIDAQIPIVIKNTFNATASGTLISHHVDHASKGVKGISSISHLSLITVRGIHMVGVPGTAERLFRTLAKQNINIILISQASSEHTICFAVVDTDVLVAETALSLEFQYEIQQKYIKLERKSQQTIIAVVGENMAGAPGVAGKFCYALGENKININAIAQGASERNISLAIDTEDAPKALNAIHQFFFETHKRLNLIFIGAGNVGAALLALLAQQAETLLSKGYIVNVVALTNSKKYIFNPNGIDLKNWSTQLKNANTDFDITHLLEAVKKTSLTNLALVDCTASTYIVENYKKFAENHIHIVTPNKYANVLPWDQYMTFKSLMAQHHCHFLFEANVGAGLPVISTLHDLLMGGDNILSIEGIFSGTLSYLFNQYDGTIQFSKIVREAHGQGLTEPDPREDLSGSDVARKLLILARQLGRKMEFTDVEIENLIPLNLRNGVFHENFYQQFAKYDEFIKKRFIEAEKNNCVLRYVGKLTIGGASASVSEIPKTHPLARAKNSDNIITFTTARYSASPLVIQGPGAGAEVTALGVFSDIYKLLHYLPY